ncbi:hypothetical protein [Sphingomonas sp. LY160]|uniref:hypothetical protein n=1 Tax=Sphingomonas sp. LY160 TaxID=3095342 RepID=UPI002ADEDA49|nr:hypothetical protein [Sphingomonas sp. LY160]MEA1071300.1 hypothetical protein [Sphingomonas sp. LY160]
MKIAFAAVAAPTFGPAIVTLFGVDVPVIGLALSVGGLLLARMIAPPPLRQLNMKQEAALTALLLIVLFLIVTGQLFGSGKPLGAGMAVIWGVGLGFSGLLAIELFGSRVLAMIRAMLDTRGQ